MSNASNKNRSIKPPSKPAKKPATPAKTMKSAQRGQLRPTMGRSEPKPSAAVQKLNNLIKSIDMRQLFIKNMAFVITGIIVMYIAPRIAFIPLPSWVTGVLAGAGLKLVVHFKGKNAKKWRKDMEYGSARWSA